MTLHNHRTTARRELLRVHGRDITVKQYSFGDENEYNDRPKNLEDEYTVRARVQRSSDARTISRADGEEVEADITIYVDDTVDVQDSPPQTEFVADGATYVAVRSDYEDNGLLAVDCRREE